LKCEHEYDRWGLKEAYIWNGKKFVSSYICKCKKCGFVLECKVSSR
jgi:hypothetical protein